MKIIRLEAENVKRLQAIEIVPQGDTVIIGGKNEQGKSSALDSIAYALGGKKLIPQKPINKDHDKAKASVQLDNGLTVTRTFTQNGGGSLIVSNEDGSRHQSPQKILDRLTGSMALDPLAFTRLEDRQQLEMLKSLVGLDFSAEDRKRKELYDERTQANRDLKKTQARLEQMPAKDETVAEEVNVSALMEKLNQIRDHNARIKEKEWESGNLDDRIKKKHAYIEDLKRQLQESEQSLSQLQDKKTTVEQELSKMELKDDQPIQDKISKSEAINEKVRQNQDRGQVESEVVELEAQTKAHTKEIADIDQAKQQVLSQAQFPVDGLSFDENGILYNELPFNQASQAEQLRVSIGMGFAMNPKLKVLLIRDGSLLDEDSLRLIAELAAEHQGQVWIERVGEGKECQVVIEDGQVKQ